ncbi:MAG: hypothetical protein KAR64_03225 [Thermoplasmatales archaeon]|nr:hypothetical protein [Thermoplasmatales archaeon]
MEENDKDRWFKVFIVILIVVIGFALLISIFGFGIMSFGMMGFGWLFMLLPFVLMIVIIYAILDRDTVSYYDRVDSIQTLE